MVHRQRHKKNDTKAHQQGDKIYNGIYRDIKHTCTNKRHGIQAQTRDMEHRHRQETRYTGTDKRHGTQAQTKGKNDAKAHKQGDMIYTGLYRHGTHFHKQRHGNHLLQKETWYTGTGVRMKI